MHTYSPLFMNSPFFGGGLSLFVAAGVVWTLAWKGWALWLASRRGEKTWFIVLLIVNTIGILEIIYIFAIAKQKDVKTFSTQTAPHEHEKTAQSE